MPPQRNRPVPHIRVPRSLVYAGLPPLAVIAWCVLDDLAREQPAVRVTQRVLGATIGVGDRQARRMLELLEDAGFVASLPQAGGPSVYQPLHRPRAVRIPVDNPVSSDDRPRSSMSGHPGQICPGLTGVLHARAGEEGQQAPAAAAAPAALALTVDRGRLRAPRRAAWCGACDPDTRLLQRPDGVARCHACHPLGSADPPF